MKCKKILTTAGVQTDTSSQHCTVVNTVELVVFSQADAAHILHNVCIFPIDLSSFC